MLTDGQVHDVPKSAQVLGFDAPVHALLTGMPDEFDRRIEVLKAPRYGIVGSSRDIELRVVETGRKGRAGERVALKIRREGKADEARAAQIGRTVSIPMAFPHAGQNIVEIELETAPGELTAANNRVVVVAEGVRENLRVLLVSGEPHAGERVWRNLLKSDAAVDLVHFTILRPPQKQDGTPINQLSLIAFPTRELFSEKIKDFDLIIFDRYQHRDILQTLYYDNIARYVQEGGALLVASGDDYAGKMSLAYTSLSSVLPAMPTGQLIERPFKAKISGDGQKHPVTRGLPGSEGKEPTWGRWFRQVDISPTRGRVLMSGADERPLLVLDRKSKGRVALLLSDQAWLWARGYEGGGPHSDLLRRLSHWLMKEPDLEEERLLASAKGLKLTIERRSMEEKVAPVQVSAPGGEASEVTLDQAGPGLWRSTIDVKAPGLYKMETQSTLGQLTAVAHAGIEDAREMNEVTATDEKMRPLVEATGGGVFWTRGGGLLSARDLGRRRAAHLHAGQCPRAGRLGLARPQGPRGLRDPRRQADPDVHGLPGARRPARPAGRHLVARGTIVVIPEFAKRISGTRHIDLGPARGLTPSAGMTGATRERPRHGGCGGDGQRLAVRHRAARPASPRWTSRSAAPRRGR